MKKNKRFLSLILAIAMVLGLGVSAWAAPAADHTITIKQSEPNHIYEAYQIFKGGDENAITYSTVENVILYDEKHIAEGKDGFDSTKPAYYSNDEGVTRYAVRPSGDIELAGDPVKFYERDGNTLYELTAADGERVITSKQLTEATWGENLNYNTPVDGKVFAEALAEAFPTVELVKDLNASSSVNSVLIALSNLTDTENANKLADVIAKYITGSPVATGSTQTDGEYVLTPTVADGYYFIKDKDNNGGTTDGKPQGATDYILQVVENVTVAAKSDTPDIDKKIVEDGSSRKDGSFKRAKSGDNEQSFKIDKETGKYIADSTKMTAEAYAALTANAAGDKLTEDPNQAVLVTNTTDTDYNYSPAYVDTQGKYYEMETRVDANTASVGEYVKYEITSKVPDMQGYNKYFFIVNDTLSAGLTPIIKEADGVKTFETGADAAHPVEIKVGSTTLTHDSIAPVAGVKAYKADNSLAAAGDAIAYYSADSGTTKYTVDSNGVIKDSSNRTYTLNDSDPANLILVHAQNGYYYSEVVVGADGSHAIKIVFEDFIKYNTGDEIVITYYAQVNTKAILENNGNPNKVDLTYSRNPNEEGKGKPEKPDEPGPDDITGKTPEKEVITYVTEVVLKKVNNNNEPLKGAIFEISSENSYVPAVKISDEYFEVPLDATGETYFYKIKGENYDTDPTDVAYTTTDPATIAAGDATNKAELLAQYLEWDGTKATKKYVEKITTTVEYRQDGTAPYKRTITTDDEGLICFGNLGVGDYLVKETKAPTGYNKLEDDINIRVIWDEESKQFTVWQKWYKQDDNFDEEEVTEEGVTKRGNWVKVGRNEAIDMNYTRGTESADKPLDGANSWQFKVENRQGSELPETGGIGTTIFYILGSLLVIGAGVLLITRKRIAVQNG